MANVHVILDAELHQRLRDAAHKLTTAKHRVWKSDIIRLALTAFLDHLALVEIDPALENNLASKPEK